MAKNKHFLKKIMISRVWLTIFSFIVIILLVNSISMFSKRVKVWQKVEHLKNEKEVLLERKRVIEAKNESLETEFGQEAVLRERFNVARPGEEVIIVTEAEPLPKEKESQNGIMLFFKKLFK